MKGIHPGGRYVLPSGERVLAAIHLLPDQPEEVARDHLYVVTCDGEILRFGKGGATEGDATQAGDMYVYPAARARTALTVDDLVPDPDPDPEAEP